MKRYTLLIFFLSQGFLGLCQYTGLTASANNTRFCSQGSVIKVYGSIYAQANVSNNYHFVGMIYHFYYFNGSSINPIGNYTVNTSSGSLVTSYFNINPVYFDGSQISGAQVVTNGYNPGLPKGGGFFSTAINIPWYVFPTSTGIQFYVAVEAIDQQGNTTVVSPRYAFDNPILYQNGVLAKPVLNATKTVLCASDQSGLSTNPDLSGSYNYLWYQDGSVVLGQFGPTLTVSTPGTYNAYIYDGCQNVTSDNVIIKAGQVPDPPTITQDKGPLLCDGASANLTTAPSFGGVINWSTAITGNSISVNTAGSYYAVETNACGTSGSSNVLSFTTGAKPSAPVIAPASDQVLCNGAIASLYSSGGNITWSNGLTGNSITTNVAGTYFTYDQNNCGNSPNSNVVTITTATCPPPAPGTSFQVCPGTLKTLDAGPGYDTYLWSNGETTQTISVGPGTYSVTVTRYGCSAVSNNVTVSYFSVTTPVITASGATTLCAGISVTLSSSVGASYSWSNGATSPNITVGNAGGYYVVVTDPNGCPATSNTVNVVVNPLPSGSVSGSATICQNAAAPVITFAGNSATAPYTFRYQINGGPVLIANSGAGSTATVTAQTNVAGTFNYQLLSVQESSSTTCSNAVNSSVVVVVNPLPSATITGSTFVCQNSIAPQVKFAGSNGTPPYTFTYQLNNGSAQTISTSTGSSITLDVPTLNPGTFTYTLISVKDASSTACLNSASGTATVVIDPLPTASISGNTAVCQNSSSPKVTFTGAGGIAPYTFNYQVNGGALQTVSTTSLSSSLTVNVPTVTPGVITYTLVSVQESGITSCVNVASGSVNVTVNQLPVASIAGSATVCQYAANPSITFSAMGGVAPYTFRYSINGGAVQTVVASGSSVQVSVPTHVAGTFAYQLISVQDGSTTACLNAAAGTATVVVNPQPANAILAAPVQHLCNGSSGQITVFDYTPGFSYTWYKDGSMLKTSTLDTIMTVSAGSYTVLATSDKGCDAASASAPLIMTVGSVTAPVITGSLKVCPGGASVIAVASSEQFDWFQWKDSLNKKILAWDSLFSAAAGQYHVFVRANGCYDSTLVAVTANDTAYPAGTLTVFPSKVPYGGRVTLTANARNAVRYTWDLNGEKAVTDTNVLVQQFYTTSDSLPITLQAISERNCMTAFTSMVAVGPRPLDSIPDKSFTGNLKDWNLYPVPFQQQLTVSVVLKKNETVRLDLFSVDGRWLHSWEFKGAKGENLFHPDNLGSLPKGVPFFMSAVYNGQKHFDKIYKY